MMRVKNKCVVLMIVFIVFIFNNCFSHMGKKYEAIDSNFMLDSGKSISVLSGRIDDTDVLLSDTLRKQLSVSGKFKVMPEDEMRKRIKEYPFKSHLIDFRIINDIEYNKECFTPIMNETSKKRIDEIQKSLQTDYVMVVWIDTTRVVTSSTFTSPSNIINSGQMFVVSRIYSYPDGKLVGFSARWFDTSSIFSSEDDIIKETSADIMDQVIDKTK
jgi:hypothetical protein